jgi:hypothetical protein
MVQYFSHVQYSSLFSHCEQLTCSRLAAILPPEETLPERLSTSKCKHAGYSLFAKKHIRSAKRRF